MGSTRGKMFCVTNFGESHGPAIGCVIDGCPPGMKLQEVDIQTELDRRKPGTSRFVTQRREPDQVEILSGVYQGYTTGTPIALLIRNQDARSKDYSAISDTFRPGHADYTYQQKYGIRDPRGGGRSSARLTAPTVAAGAVAKKYLQESFGLSVTAYLTQLGSLKVPIEDIEEASSNAFFAPNCSMLPTLEKYMDQLRRDGDSCGAVIEVLARGVPAGLGEPIYDRLDAELAHALMGLNAVKAVEIGSGFEAVSQLGSEHGDEITPDGFLSNNAGGILGGISSGQDIVLRIALKPTSSIRIARRSVDVAGTATMVTTEGRHDPCVGLRAAPIAEALTSLVLIDHVLRQQDHQGKMCSVSIGV